MSNSDSSLRDMLHILWIRKALFFGVFFCCFLVGAGVLLTRSPIYECSRIVKLAGYNVPGEEVVFFPQSFQRDYVRNFVLRPMGAHLSGVESMEGKLLYPRDAGENSAYYMTLSVHFRKRDETYADKIFQQVLLQMQHNEDAGLQRQRMLWEKEIVRYRKELFSLNYIYFPPEYFNFMWEKLQMTQGKLDSLRHSVFVSSTVCGISSSSLPIPVYWFVLLLFSCFVSVTLTLFVDFVFPNKI